MATIHAYFGLEALPPMTAQQLVILRDALFALADNGNAQPAKRFHYRIRLDNRAIIFQGEFDQAHLLSDAVRNWLADVFGVAADTITWNLDTSGSSYIVTYSRGGTPYLRYALFGYDGAWPTCAESQAAAAQYLQNHAAAWGEQT